MVWKVAAVVMLGPFMTSLDSTVVNVSLSALTRELNTSLGTIQWVTTGYLLALALTLPLSGWLVDRIGAKRVYLICFSVFTLASLLCGSASTVEELISYRVLQGAAGGLLAPMAQMMLARVAGPNLGRVIAYGAAPVMLGPVAGPSLAGFVLQHASWRWIFLINLPIGVISMILSWWVLPRDTDEVNPRRLDLFGYVMLGAALITGLHSLEGLGRGEIGESGYEIELLGSAALMFSFVVGARRTGESAIIDLALFRGRNFSAAAATQFLSNFLSLGGQMLLPLYLFMAQGHTPAQTGLLLAPMGIGMFCSFVMMGHLTERFGPRKVAATGALLALIGTVPYVIFSADAMSPLFIEVSLFVRGVGLGSLGVPSISSAYAHLPKRRIPIATTAMNIVQRLGGPVGTTFLAICLHLGMNAHSEVSAQGFTLSFFALCVIHLLSVGSALRLPDRIAAAESLTVVDVEVAAE